MNKFKGYKTVIFSVLLAMLGACTTYSDDLRRLIPPHYFGVAMIIIAGIVAGLRAVTTTPILQGDN